MKHAYQIERKDVWQAMGRLVVIPSVVVLMGLLVLFAGRRMPANLTVHHVKRAHYLMGTIFEIEVYHKDKDRAGEAIETAFQEIRRADELMSHYREDSQISLLNRFGARHAVSIDSDLYELLRTSVSYTFASSGAFDITANSLTEAWKAAEARGAPLSQSELVAVITRLGADRLRFNDRGQTVHFDREGVKVDLGAIGKGWVVDRAAALLRKSGIRSALISAGTSTLYAIGAPPGQTAWRIGVRDPQFNSSEDVSNGYIGIVDLRDASLSTSSASERSFFISGVRYSHIFDPRSGLPADGMSSATVVSTSATESDAMSTAVFVMGISEGLQLLRSRRLGGLLMPTGTAGAPNPLVVEFPAAGTRIQAVQVEAGT